MAVDRFTYEQRKIILKWYWKLENAWEYIDCEQDEEPPHYNRDVMSNLEATFPGRWIGRRRGAECPPRLTDLALHEFQFWGYLKDAVNDTYCNLELRYRVVCWKLK
jgi:hypothetical protein